MVLPLKVTRTFTSHHLGYRQPLIRGFCTIVSLSCFNSNQGSHYSFLRCTSIKRRGLRQIAWNSLVGNMEGTSSCIEPSQMGIVFPANEAHVHEAVEALKSEQVIAVPTDTLYGFACDACSKEAVSRIYEIKGRKLTSPLAISVGQVSDIHRFALTENLPDGLLEALLPGPVTVVLLRGIASALDESLNPGLESIGVRVPDSDFICSVARSFGSAIALTSANLSGQPSSIGIKDFEALWPSCRSIYDGGVLPVGRAGSTVVDLTEPGKYRILRPGSALEETTSILHVFRLHEMI